MIKKLLAGFVGGIAYILVTWGATLTGILDWLEQNPNQPQAGFSILAPFSLMAIFMFVSIYVYHQWQPEARQTKTFGKLMIIGTAFALGATITQLSLMQLDGIQIGNSLIIAGIFFTSSILIALLICSFYLFIKPLRKAS